MSAVGMAAGRLQPLFRELHQLRFHYSRTPALNALLDARPDRYGAADKSDLYFRMRRINRVDQGKEDERDPERVGVRSPLTGPTIDNAGELQAAEAGNRLDALVPDDPARHVVHIERHAEVRECLLDGRIRLRLGHVEIERRGRILD